MRFYSALLRLYPASFRAEYGGEMRAILSARLRETPGTLSRLMLWIETVADVVLNAALVHWDILRQDLRYTGGNGGQIFMAIPDLELAIAFTGGNYNQAATFKAQREYIPRYILSAIN